MISKLILVIDGLGIACNMAIRWVSLYLTDDKSTLVQVMAKAIAWANVDPDLCPHMTSLGHNELNPSGADTRKFWNN